MNPHKESSRAMSMISRFLYSFPIFVTIIGIAIHLLALLGFSFGEQPALIHWMMLIIDSVVVVLLIKRTALGYFLGLLLYVQQTISQTYWAFQVTNTTSYCIQAVASILCFFSLVSLILGFCATHVRHRATCNFHKTSAKCLMHF